MDDKYRSRISGDYASYIEQVRNAAYQEMWYDIMLQYFGWVWNPVGYFTHKDKPGTQIWKG